MSAVETNTSASPWYKHPWVWFLISLKVAVITACFITGVIIYKNPTSMVVDDYYDEGRAINLRLDKVAYAIELNIAFKLQIQSEHLTLEYLSGDNNNGTALLVNFYHATQSSEDFELRLTRAADGIYRAQLPKVLEGHWRVDINPFDQSWEVRQNISLPNQYPIELRPQDYGVQ